MPIKRARFRKDKETKTVAVANQISEKIITKGRILKKITRLRNPLVQFINIFIRRGLFSNKSLLLCIKLRDQAVLDYCRQIIVKSQIQQIVIWKSGFNPLSIKLMSRFKDLKIIEMDVASVLNEKINITKSEISQSKIYHCFIDDSYDNSFDQITNYVEFDQTLKTLVIYQDFIVRSNNLQFLNFLKKFKENMVQGSYCIFSFLEAKGLNIVSDFPSTKKEFIFDHIKQLGLVLWRQTSIDWYVNMNHFSKIEKIFLKTINTPQCVIVENPVI